MHLNWSPEELAFRDEVRAFIADELTPELSQDGIMATRVYT